MLTVTTADAEATRAVGEALGGCLPSGALVTLSGGLGAGKTTFVQGLARGLGHAGRVTSPTYTLVHLYALPAVTASVPVSTQTSTGGSTPGDPGGHLVHVDLYRINAAADFLELGLDERRTDGDRIVVEWPSNAGDALADVDLMVAFRDASRDVGVIDVGVNDDLAVDQPRVLDFTAGTADGAAVLACLATVLDRPAAGA